MTKRKRTHKTTKNTMAKPPVSKLLEFSTDCNGPFTIVTDIVKEGKFEKLYKEWYDHPATTMWCAESFIMYVKRIHPNCICVLKEDFKAITKGKFIPATKEEYEAENN
jgi:hypothetical protein